MFDTAVAAVAAVWAFFEMAEWTATRHVLVPGAPGVPAADGGALVFSLPPRHAPVIALIAAALTALPLAARRFYPITVWLAIAVAVVVAAVFAYMPPVALGTAVYAAYSAITHSRYRNLAIAMVSVVTIFVAATLGQQLPRCPVRLTAILAIVPAAVAKLWHPRAAAPAWPTPPPSCAAPPRTPRRPPSARWRRSGRGSRRSCTTSSRTTYRS